MTQRRPPASHVYGGSHVSAPAGSPRAAASQDFRWFGAWVWLRMTQGFEWIMQLGLPTAATILELQNVKRRISETGGFDQLAASNADRKGEARVD